MRTATKHDEELIIKILSVSFDQNKSVNFVVKQDGKRKIRLEKLIRYSVFMGLNFGRIFITDDEKSCCILLDPQLKKTTIKLLIHELKLLFSVIGLTNVIKVIRKEQVVHAQHPKSDYYHLWYIGVLPGFDGKGIGSKLIREVTTFCVENKRSVYLETSNPLNKSFYESNGFVNFYSTNKGMPFEMTFFRFDPSIAVNG